MHRRDYLLSYTEATIGTLIVASSKHFHAAVDNLTMKMIGNKDKSTLRKDKNKKILLSSVQSSF